MISLKQKVYGNRMNSTFERVKNIIVDFLDIDETRVTPKSNFITDLGIDSLDTIELIMIFEEEFLVDISDEEAEKIITVQDMVDFIEKYEETWK